MKEKRVKLITGEIRDMSEKDAQYAVEHGLGEIIGTVYNLSRDFDQPTQVAVNA
ncbi:hypothetical protein JW977_00845 [Candidatus Falkowbacteria bacterium]|nr:hypothetical protein [Candidatus Falkowbacteria bacterium]